MCTSMVRKATWFSMSLARDKAHQMAICSVIMKEAQKEQKLHKRRFLDLAREIALQVMHLINPAKQHIQLSATHVCRFSAGSESGTDQHAADCLSICDGCKAGSYLW